MEKKCNIMYVCMYAEHFGLELHTSFRLLGVFSNLRRIHTVFLCFWVFLILVCFQLGGSLNRLFFDCLRISSVISLLLVFWLELELLKERNGDEERERYETKNWLMEGCKFFSLYYYNTDRCKCTDENPSLC